MWDLQAVIMPWFLKVCGCVLLKGEPIRVVNLRLLFLFELNYSMLFAEKHNVGDLLNDFIVVMW